MFVYKIGKKGVASAGLTMILLLLITFENDKISLALYVKHCSFNIMIKLL